jgi:hypothetical protein
MIKFSKEQTKQTMTTLHDDWLTEGVLDFEYKKYVLLSYLHHIEGQFLSDRLYPYLPDLRFHLNACIRLQAKKQSIRAAFPKEVKGVDLTTWKPVYEESVQDDPHLSEINDILDYAISKFAKTLEDGAERFSEVGACIRISPLGIVPLRTEEGYLFFLDSSERTVSIFRYQLALYNQMKERYLKTAFVDTIRTGLGHTVEQIKIKLVRENQALPNPATYVVESKQPYPLHETLLPVAKHMMVRYLNVA